MTGTFIKIANVWYLGGGTIFPLAAPTNEIVVPLKGVFENFQ